MLFLLFSRIISTMSTERKSIAILDANAFISMSNILNLCNQYRIITTEDVLGELKDSKTKEFVESLPFDIETVESDQKSVELVKQFSKKTGDIASLSQIDMELVALAYKLYKKEGLQDLLRKEPPPIFEKDDLLDVANQDQLSSSEYEDQSDEEETKLQTIVEKAEESINPQQQNKDHPNPVKEEKSQKNPQDHSDKQEEEWIAVPVKPKRKVSSSSSESDDEEGWITSKNYEKKMAEMTSSFKQDLQQEGTFNIWLVSADFALQNVAVQMGIKLLSLDGRKITSIRRFIYECYLCWKKYRIYDEKVRLCKNCGYNSLSKIAYSIDDKGSMVLHRKKGWKPNQKILEAKERKFQQQQRNKKHQHARRKKKPSIFEN